MNNNFCTFLVKLNEDTTLCPELKKKILTCFIEHNSCKKCFFNNIYYFNEEILYEEFLDEDYPYRYLSQKTLNFIYFLYNKFNQF